MLPWMCGRQTLTIVVSSPCMTQAQMIVAVVAAAVGGRRGAVSPHRGQPGYDRNLAMRLNCRAGWVDLRRPPATRRQSA